METSDEMGSETNWDEQQKGWFQWRLWLFKTLFSHQWATTQCDLLTPSNWPLSGWSSHWPAWTMNQKKWLLLDQIIVIFFIVVSTLTVTHISDARSFSLFSLPVFLLLSNHPLTRREKRKVGYAQRNQSFVCSWMYVYSIYIYLYISGQRCKWTDMCLLQVLSCGPSGCQDRIMLSLSPWRKNASMAGQPC